MHKIIQVVFYVLLCMTTFNPSSFAQERPLIFGSASFPPFFGENMDNNGPLIEIIREAFAVNNRKIIIKWFPWKRALLSAKHGNVDGLAFAWYTKEREKFLHFGEAIVPNIDIGLFKHKKNTASKYNDLSILKDKTVGYVRGYAIPEVISNAGAILYEASEDLQLLRMLAAGRIDYVYTDKHVGNYLMLKHAPELLKELNWFVTLRNYPNYLAISKEIKNEDPEKILQQYANGLKVIKKSGLYERILSKYQLR